MADYSIRVVIDPTAAQRGGAAVRRELQGVSAQADRMSATLRRLFTGFAFGLVVRELGQMADQFTTIQNRLRTVTQGQGQLARATRDVFEIAQRTRSEFRSTAELYARVGLAARELGISQQELAHFTESVNQAVILSGASGAEASAGLIQLAQGLASGTLRGDELRSVLEQLPKVADVIAKSLKVTRGELREMGAEGEITAGIVLRAFREAREELAVQFAQSVPTLSQAFTVLRNAVVEYVGSADQANGVTATMSRLVIELAGNIDNLARSVGGLAVSFAILTGPRALGGLIRLVRSNPIGLFVVGITLAIGQLTTFADRIAASVSGVTTLRDVGVGLFNVISDVGVAAFNALGIEVDSLVPSIEDVMAGFAAFVEGSIKGLDVMIGAVVGAVRAIIVAFEQLPRVIEGIFVRAMNAAIQVVNDALDSITSKVNSVLEAFGHTGIVSPQLALIEAEFSGAAEDIGAAVSDAFASGFDQTVVQDAIEAARRTREILEREGAGGGATIPPALDGGSGGSSGSGGGSSSKKKKGPTFADIVRELEREAEVLRLSGVEREIRIEQLRAEDALSRSLTDAEADLIAGLVEINEALYDQSVIYDDIRGPQEDFVRQQEALNVLLADGRISAQDYTDALIDMRIRLLERSRDVQSGVERGLLINFREMTDEAQIAEDFITGSFRSMEDALTQFAETGKLDFTELVDSMLADLARLIARLLIAQALQAALGSSGGGGGLFGGGGGGFGGILGSLFGGSGGAAGGGSTFFAGTSQVSGLAGALPFTGFASGGVAPAGRPILVGERGPELMTLGRSSRVYPADETAAIGGSTVNVVVNNNAKDTKVEVRRSESPRGGQNLEIQIDEVVSRAIMNPRSQTGRALGTRFGATPVLTKGR